MTRTLHVYPEASIAAASWTLTMKVSEAATGVSARFTETVPAGVFAEQPLDLLKVSWDLIVADADTDRDVADALFIDDIKPGSGVETVWGNWQSRAEGIITGLTPGYTLEDFLAAWTMGDTQAMRNDAQRALTTGPGGIGRGWTVVAGSVHQHEGDGSSTDG